MEAARTWCARRMRTPTSTSSEPSRGTEPSHSTVRRGSGPSGMTWLTSASSVSRRAAASQSTSWRSRTTESQSSLEAGLRRLGPAQDGYVDGERLVVAGEPQQQVALHRPVEALVEARRRP